MRVQGTLSSDPEALGVLSPRAGPVIEKSTHDAALLRRAMVWNRKARLDDDPFTRRILARLPHEFPVIDERE